VGPGTLAVAIYHIGVFFLGFLWGIVNALLLNFLFLSRLSYSMREGNDLLWGVSLASAVTCGTLAVFAHDHTQDAPRGHPRKVLIFLQTSFVGAYLVVKGLAHAAGHPLRELTVGTSSAEGMFQEQQFLALGIVVLGLLGSAVQMHWTHYEHCGMEDRDDRDDAGYGYEGIGQDQEKGMMEETGPSWRT